MTVPIWRRTIGSNPQPIVSRGFQRRYPLVMAIPDLTLRRATLLLEHLIERRLPPHIRDQVRMSVETRGNHVTLFEHRPVWRMPDEWTNGKNYFITDWGNVRLVALDFEIECDRRCAQYRFVL